MDERKPEEIVADTVIGGLNLLKGLLGCFIVSFIGFFVAAITAIVFFILWITK